MRKTILNNLLLYAVQREMFCGCGTCLDVSTAVYTDLPRTKVRCDNCWCRTIEELVPKKEPGVIAKHLAGMEADGDLVYGTKAKRPSFAFNPPPPEQMVLWPRAEGGAPA